MGEEGPSTEALWGGRASQALLWGPTLLSCPSPQRVTMTVTAKKGPAPTLG